MWLDYLQVTVILTALGYQLSVKPLLHALLLLVGDGQLRGSHGTLSPSASSKQENYRRNR